MYLFKKLIITVLTLICVGYFSIYAQPKGKKPPDTNQPDPKGNGNPGGRHAPGHAPGPPDNPPVPISGLEFLLVLGGGYGMKKIYDLKKKEL